MEHNRSTLFGKHIVLGISGGIAAYKSAMLLRLLIKKGAEVQVVITPNGKEFITPATLAALSGKPVVSEFFAANTGEWHSHVDLGLWADLMIVAPATASTIAKMACGVADNMLITTYLSAKDHVMVAPAMDLDMYRHPSTQRNLATHRSDGVDIIEPASGFLASGLSGKGRMEEPEKIVEAAEEYFARAERNESLSGKKVLITAGPTYEKIDPVRFIGNYSSGKMGFALARACRQAGAQVVLVAGPVERGLSLPEDVERINVETALEMHQACSQHFPQCDIAIFSAAVADYRPAVTEESKIKREGKEQMTISLVSNPDIAASMGKMKRKPDCGKPQYTVGFALETDHETANALRKLEAKNLDMVVLNSLRDDGAGFMTDTNKISLITSGSREDLPLMAKDECARAIVEAVSRMPGVSKI